VRVAVRQQRQPRQPDSSSEVCGTLVKDAISCLKIGYCVWLCLQSLWTIMSRLQFLPQKYYYSSACLKNDTSYQSPIGAENQSLISTGYFIISFDRYLMSYSLLHRKEIPKNSENWGNEAEPYHLHSIAASLVVGNGSFEYACGDDYNVVTAAATLSKNHIRACCSGCIIHRVRRSNHLSNNND
jgi:hypothetical protein